MMSTPSSSSASEWTTSISHAAWASKHFTASAIATVVWVESTMSGSLTVSTWEGRASVDLVAAVVWSCNHNIPIGAMERDVLPNPGPKLPLPFPDPENPELPFLFPNPGNPDPKLPLPLPFPDPGPELDPPNGGLPPPF